MSPRKLDDYLNVPFTVVVKESCDGMGGVARSMAVDRQFRKRRFGFPLRS